MFGQRLSRIVGLVGVLALVVVGVLSAQSSQTAPAGVADLLTELRGLRADVNRAAGASMRMQLLVARLSLQEQRISAVARQVTDVQAQLGTAVRQRTDLEVEVKRLEDVMAGRTAPPEVQQNIEKELPQIKAELSQRQAREQQLRNQEADLSGLLTAEQNRWTDFNGRLDDLERSLPTGTGR